MINGKSVLAIVPARGGSKGVPRKNIRPLAGKPLIAWTIEAACKSGYIDRLILSSEDAEIIGVAKALGCEVPFVRPAELAQDDTPGIDPVLHALKALPGYDYVVLLQPTSPLRTTADIDNCIARCEEKAAPACVSVTEPAHHPQWMFTLSNAEVLLPISEQRGVRRQNLPDVFALNGAVYVARTAWVFEAGGFLGEGTQGYVMPSSRSIDIDTEQDFAFAACLLQRQENP
ncbi:MAG: acylneuraminate cytidylyltransferase [Betaproteobacteria bacterium RIFCSPLOWO2_12_FULL_63_13]|nr:MAG: acylneuraminate cytidylyltransferase [Betaproteobacteria bacterium RIFCSPLOWO2_12_FULL_63_13]